MSRKTHDVTAQIEDEIDDSSAEEKRKAALVACNFAGDVAEARMFLDMLGLRPTPDEETR